MMNRKTRIAALASLLLGAAGCADAASAGAAGGIASEQKADAEPARPPPAPEPAPEPDPDPIVEFVPMGRPSPGLVKTLARTVEGRLRFRVRIREPLPMPKAAWYPPRKRWRADELLDALDALDTGDAVKAIGITELEISTTKGARYDWGIAGLGRLPGKSCVLTAFLFRRYQKKTPKRYVRYMENLVLHELGHTLGLDHCPLDRCIMADAKGSARRAARLSINEFCPRCTRRLGDRLRDQTVKGDWTAGELQIIGEAP